LRDRSPAQGTYSGRSRVEFQNISDKAQREWLAQQMEPVLNRPSLTRAGSAILFSSWRQRISSSSCGGGAGRQDLSLEGCESLIPMLNTLVDEGAGARC
jgi:2-oxoglutarate dehydrogenase complex dehydrogenase (E1) component-like enzyme